MNPQAENQNRRNRMKTLRFRLEPQRQPGELAVNHRCSQRILNTDPDPRPRAQDRLAALLKTQAREVMRAVTECPPASVPAAVARLSDLDSIIRLAIETHLVDEGERSPSDHNPIHAHTLADFRLALSATRQYHRAPAFVSRWGDELAELRAEMGAMSAKIDLLASLLSTGGVQ
jgi:hypothetical protein